MATKEVKDAEQAREGEDLLHKDTSDSRGDKRRGLCTCTKKKLTILVIVLIMLFLYALGLGIGLAIGLSKKNDTQTENKPDVKLPLGAVVSDHEACSDVGRDILMRHGTATDAAIATLICVGVRTPHSMGIGGGLFMVIYDKGSKKTLYIDGRETAPHSMTTQRYNELKNANVMVVYDYGLRETVTIDGLSVAPSSMRQSLYDYMSRENINARRIAVPGELKSYKLAHDKYGRLPWADLFQPTIQMIRAGFPLSEASAKALKYMSTVTDIAKRFPVFCSVFCSNTTTGEVKTKDDIIHWPKMADTLEGIARDGPDYIYDSSVTYSIVDEIRELGGDLMYRDFAVDYKGKMGPAYSVDLGDYILHTMPGATGGPVVTMIANIIKGFKLTKGNITSLKDKADVYHTIVEAMKFTYADRATLGDPDFEDVSETLDKMKSDIYADYIRHKIKPTTQNESYYKDTIVSYEETPGTSHIAVLSPYGDAVSVTSTINWYFGSLEMSNSTGIIWNNEMDDFSAKSNENSVNFIEPGKRPRSSMAPVIVVDKQDKVKVVIGAAGGSKIANAVAQVLIRLLWLDQPLNEAVEEKRFTHMLSKNILTLEKDYPQDMRDEFEKRGHKIKDDSRDYLAVVEALMVDSNGVIKGHSDSRKQPGKTSYMFDYQHR